MEGGAMELLAVMTTTIAVAPPVAVASVLARRSWAVELTDTRWSQGHAVIPGGKHMEL